MVPTVVTRKRPPLIVADTIIPREVRWLWHPYIPTSAATLIFGPGGHGKSHITVDIAAALSQGRALPGQTRGTIPQKVLMLSAEDDFDTILVPRLMRAGANLANVAFPKDPFTLDQDGLKMLDSYMQDFSAGVVFIDPIVSYIGGKVDMNKANQTREFTGGLHAIAMRKQTSIIIVGHSRKSRDDDTSADWERAMGSADFSNAVRSVLYVTKSGDGTRVMRHVKANYSALGPSYGFEFGDHGFTWLGEVEEEDDFQTGIRASKRNSQEEWLRKLLSNGPMRATDIEAHAKAAKMSMRTVNRVKPHVAESYMQHIDGKPTWFWTLKASIQPVGAEDDEIHVQGVENGRGTGLSDEGDGWGSSGSGVERGPGKRNRASVVKVGKTGRGKGLVAVPAASGGQKVPAPDPKAIARAFMAQRGLDA